MEESINPIEEYMKKKNFLSDKERQEMFEKTVAPLLGKADSDTLAYRKACKELGAEVVFAEGMTREEVLKVLSNPEIQKINKSLK